MVEENISSPPFPSAGTTVFSSFKEGSSPFFQGKDFFLSFLRDKEE